MSNVSRYIVKNNERRQLVVEMNSQATPDEIFSVPPKPAIGYITMTQEEANYVKNRYGRSVLVLPV